MRLIHYSAKPLTEVHSCPIHDEEAPCGAFKTQGLWVSVDDAWLRWCEAESFGLARLRCATEVILAPKAPILHIKTARALDAFTQKFLKHQNPPWLKEIDWNAVKAKYAGLIIAPYQWSRRLTPHTQWYYGWDCASGVIWDASAVAELRPLPMEKPVLAV